MRLFIESPIDGEDFVIVELQGILLPATASGHDDADLVDGTEYIPNAEIGRLELRPDVSTPHDDSLSDFDQRCLFFPLVFPFYHHAFISSLIR